MENREIPETYIKHLRKQGFFYLERIGRGSSGSVFKATQKSLGRPVAIKVFDSFFYRNDSAVKSRFIRESRILAKINHSAIPFVLTRGLINTDETEAPYTVMQFIDGITLDEYLSSHGALSLDDSVNHLWRLLDALDAVHRAQIVHRDISPHNIMISSSGLIYLIDFSIGFHRERGTYFTQATVQGHGLGHPGYAAPEQISSAADVDHRADLYSIGKVLFAMLNKFPLQSNETIDRDLSDISHGVRDIIRKSVSKNPDDRFSSANEFMIALRPYFERTEDISLTPSTAVCPNPFCQSFEWDYLAFGPTILKNSTDKICTTCGTLLVRRCPGCRRPFKGAAFCGTCGEPQFLLPKCKSCDGFLSRREFKQNTDICDRCIPKPSEIPFLSDSDIPF